MLYTSAAPAFPGAAALLPTLSAAAIIVGGMNGRAEKGVGALLSLLPMRWIGDISYSLYLWHWPLIVVATYLLGGELRFRYGIAVVLVSILLSWLSYKLIENPFRDWERLKRSVKGSLWAGAALVAVTLVVSTGTAVTPSVIARAEAPQISEGQRFGAEALTDDFSDDSLASFTDAGAPVDEVEGGFTPAATHARDDNPVVYDNGCQLEAEETVPKPCEFGDADSGTTVVLAGDSHAASLVPTLQELATAHGWRLITQTKSACSFDGTTHSRSGAAYPECDAWNDAVLEQIIDERPDLVLTIGSSDRGVWNGTETIKGQDRVDAIVDGLTETWSALSDAGIPIVALEDTPDMEMDVPECVSAHEHALSECAVSREEALGDRKPKEQPAADAVMRANPDAVVDVIDINNWVCPDADACAPVVGNVLVWRDAQHLTATYARTLAEPLGAALAGTRSAGILF